MTDDAVDVRLPETFRHALEGITDRAFCQSKRFTDQQMRADRVGAYPLLLYFEKRYVRTLRKIGVPVFAHCVVRTAEDQEKAFAAGHSKARAGQSAHNFGLAADIVHGVKGWDLNDKQVKLLRHVGNEVARACGLQLEDMIKWDPLHWEVEGWRILKAKYPFRPIDPGVAFGGSQTPMFTQGEYIGQEREFRKRFPHLGE